MYIDPKSCEESEASIDGGAFMSLGVQLCAAMCSYVQLCAAAVAVSYRPSRRVTMIIHGPFSWWSVENGVCM